MQATFTKYAVGIAAGAMALFATGGAAQAFSVSGSITQNAQGFTSVDSYDFTANSAGNVIIDVLAAGIDFGNGTSQLDSVIYLFSNDSSLDLSDLIAGTDDFEGTDTNGSVSFLDAYLSVFLNPGSYRLFISDFFFTAEEAIAGIQTDDNFFVTPADYRIDFVGDVSATPIPTPALLPGLIGMGVAAWRKRKNEQSEQVAETAEV